MGATRLRVGISKTTFCVGKYVDNSKEKIKFATAAEQNFSTLLFIIAKAIDRLPRPVYCLEDLKQMPIKGHFYLEESFLRHERYRLQNE